MKASPFVKQIVAVTGRIAAFFRLHSGNKRETATRSTEKARIRQKSSDTTKPTTSSSNRQDVPATVESG